MNLNIVREIKVDFYDSKYIQVNAKQYDLASRFILVSCYNQGEFFPIRATNHYAYIRCEKADGSEVLNACRINYEGKILIELTEQMLAAAGTCWADLIILHNKSNDDSIIKLNTNDGIFKESDGSILSTMRICINVIESATDYEHIESTDEYNALNELLIKATDDYERVIQATSISEKNAEEAMNAAIEAKNTIKESEVSARQSSANAMASATAAAISEVNAKLSEDVAKESSGNAKLSEDNAKISEENALESYLLARSYAVGDTEVRTNEEVDSAKFYYEHTKIAYESTSGSFTPMGTITFSELATVNKEVGYMYYISESFVTDRTFRCGEGVAYPAGTMVYYTSSGYWDCMIARIMTVTDDGEGNVTVEMT